MNTADSIDASPGFDLHGDMRYSVVLGKLAFDRPQGAVRVATLPDPHMEREQGSTRGQRPPMNVVHILHIRERGGQIRRQRAGIEREGEAPAEPWPSPSAARPGGVVSAYRESWEAGASDREGEAPAEPWSSPSAA